MLQDKGYLQAEQGSVPQTAGGGQDVPARRPGPQDSGEGSGERGQCQSKVGAGGRDRSAAERTCWRAACAEQKDASLAGSGQRGFGPLLRQSVAAVSM